MKMATKELFNNQKKLVTVYDFYNTIRSLVSSPIPDTAVIKNYSYNVFQETVPLSRNCKKARIDPPNCPCVEERSDLMPQFYIGHSEVPHTLDSNQGLFYNPRERKWQARLFPGKKETT